MEDARRPGGVCVVRTGPLWDRNLAGVMEGCGHGVRATGRALGVSPTMVMQHTRHLGLWRDKWTDRPKIRLRRETVGARLLERHRAGWVAYQAAGGGGPAKEMPKSAFNAYRYLIRKDREWLRSHHPLPRNARAGKGASRGYDHLYVYRQLLDEEGWIVELKRRLLELAGSLPPIPADALRQHTQHYLGQLPNNFAAIRRAIEQEKAISCK